MKTPKTIFAAEYYIGGGWIKYCIDGNAENCIFQLDAPIFGNPKTRVAEYEVVRNRGRIDYRYLKTIKEA